MSSRYKAPAECPCGGENPTGFHPFAGLIRFLPGISGDGQNTALWRLCFPFGRAMPP
ncbi:MAG: hypothetical protein LBK61_04605 [Spirochaetaceae bacterium]|nr:hypothetical protein [Spirochaetaceae bacterium]